MPGPLGTGSGGGGGASSPTQVTFAEATAVPNDTTYVDSITAAGATTNADLALRPKGTGALTAQVADNTTAGGNKRGLRAVDWQMGREDATMVASGDYSVIGGGRHNSATELRSVVGGGYYNATAGLTSTIAGGSFNDIELNGSYGVIGGGLHNSITSTSSVIAGGNSNTASAHATVISGGTANTASEQGAVIVGGAGNTASGYETFIGSGYENTASGSRAIVVGGSENTASGTNSTIPGGYAALSSIYGKFAYASGQFATRGDAQFGLQTCRATTTAAAAVSLTNDAGAFAATNHLVLPNNRVYRFTIDLVASSGTIGTASTTTYGSFGGYWKITGAIRRAATTSTTAIIGTPTVLATAVDSQLAAVSFTVLAETTYGSLQIVATGLASTQIHWVATIMTTEVG